MRWVLGVVRHERRTAKPGYPGLRTRCGHNIKDDQHGCQKFGDHIRIDRTVQIGNDVYKLKKYLRFAAGENNDVELQELSNDHLKSAVGRFGSNT